MFLAHYKCSYRIFKYKAGVYLGHQLGFQVTCMWVSRSSGLVPLGCNAVLLRSLVNYLELSMCCIGAGSYIKPRVGAGYNCV